MLWMLEPRPLGPVGLVSGEPFHVERMVREQTPPPSQPLQTRTCQSPLAVSPGGRDESRVPGDLPFSRRVQRARALTLEETIEDATLPAMVE